jgi:hypothetical protein
MKNKEMKKGNVVTNLFVGLDYIETSAFGFLSFMSCAIWLEISALDI